MDDPEERCPVCRWSDPGYIEEDDPRYLVFLTLIQRARQDNSRWDSSRLKPTAREFAIFQHGDQCRIDGVCWRITARNVEKNLLFVRGWRAGLTKTGDLISVDIDGDLHQEIAAREARIIEWEEEKAKADGSLKEARATGKFGIELVEYMTEDDWNLLSEEQATELWERYDCNE